MPLQTLSILLGLFCLVEAGRTGWIATALAQNKISFKASRVLSIATSLSCCAKSILIVIALICALLFFDQCVSSVVASGRFRHSILMVVSALVIGGIYPAIVQRFQVKPSG